jgi:exodeoxyribonuclease VII large subunit
MKVLVKVVVTYNELYGLSLQITDIDPSYTLGDMEQQRQAAVEQLWKDGVFDMNRELVFPGVVQRVAVVSSRNAAGYQDFMNELSSGGYYFEVTLFDAFMQGNDAEDSIIDALCRAAENAENYDVVVVIRGGGSVSDLGTFDSYRLSSYIAQFPLPVITGIGHDKDRSVADMVAALSLKTPTAVAVFLNESIARFENLLDEMQQFVETEARAVLSNSAQRLQNNVSALDMMTSHLFAIEKNRLSTSLIRLKETAKAYLSSRAKELSLLRQLVESNAPERIMDMGFAVVRRGGNIIHDGGQLAAGDGIEIVMRDSVVGAEVKNIKTSSKDEI